MGPIAIAEAQIGIVSIPERDLEVLRQYSRAASLSIIAVSIPERDLEVLRQESN